MPCRRYARRRREIRTRNTAHGSGETAYRRWPAADLFSGGPRSPGPLLGSEAIGWGGGPYQKRKPTRPSSRCHSGGDARYRPPEDPDGPAAARSLDPAARRLRLDRRKQLGVPRLLVGGTAAEMPAANEPGWGWRHPARRRIDPGRSENAETCEARWHTFWLQPSRGGFSPRQTRATGEHPRGPAPLQTAGATRGCKRYSGRESHRRYCAAGASIDRRPTTERDREQGSRPKAE